MLNQASTLKNEQGTAIVMGLVVMLILTVVGITAVNTSTVELQIVRNEGIYKEDLYLAEGAAHEAIQTIWGIARTDPYILLDRTRDWLSVKPGDVEMVDMGYAYIENGDNNVIGEASPIGAQTSFSAVDTGVARPGSLEMTGTNIHEWAVYGQSNKNNGRVLIQIGYRERY